MQNDGRNAINTFQTPHGNAQRFQNAVQRSTQQQKGERFQQVVRDAQQLSTDRSIIDEYTGATTTNIKSSETTIHTEFYQKTISFFTFRNQ